MGHGALDEDRAHDPEQGNHAQRNKDGRRLGVGQAKGRHLTNPIYKEFTESRLDLLYACAVGDWRVKPPRCCGRGCEAAARPLGLATEGRRGWKAGVFGPAMCFDRDKSKM